MGIFTTEVILGSFEGTTITEVDLTGLTGCSVNIKACDGPSAAVASGRRGRVKEIRATFTSTGATRRITISNGKSPNVSNSGCANADSGSSANTGYRGPLDSRAANMIISKTGNADATGGGSANSGIVITDGNSPARSQEEIHIVCPDRPFAKIIFGAAVTVTLTVPSGTEVKYCQ